MSEQGPFDNDNNQFIVSHELLKLFKWLFEFEQEALKKIIARALKHGLQDNLSYHNEGENAPELQQNVIDFFALLENILYDQINASEAEKIIQRALIPAIDHIDSKACDAATVAVCAAKATSMFENNPLKDPKATLCKELLKRWKPSKKLETH